jgi:anti-sigma-K factor RskA
VTHEEIQELLGAYALDAVDADEAMVVEVHLEECPRCRAEVAQHREVASLLVGAPQGEAPPGVWDKIAADLGDTPSPVPIEEAFGARRRPLLRVLVGLAAAAAVVLLAVLGGLVVDQRSELGDLRDTVASGEFDSWVADALAQPGTRVVSLTGPAPDVSARAIVREDGEGLLLSDDLPELETGGTYQLWGLTAGRQDVVSLGVLGPDPSRSPFHAEGAVDTLAVTREPVGGSTEPTSDPVVTGAIT